MTGIERIKAERERQISIEGYDAAHDDQHDWDELADAAACYTLTGRGGDADHPQHSELVWLWPWGVEYWKPKDPLTNLVRAGALVAAAIDRYLEDNPDVV